MVKIELEYAGNLLVNAVHGPSGVKLQTDAPVDNQGLGRSYSPTDLVATALGACMATIMGIVAKRDGLDLSGMKISVEKEMTKTTPRRIDSLKVDFVIPGKIAKEDQEKLKRAAETCPVHKSLHPDIKVITSFQWGK